MLENVRTAIFAHLRQAGRSPWESPGAAQEVGGSEGAVWGLTAARGHAFQLHSPRPAEGEGCRVSPFASTRLSGLTARGREAEVRQLTLASMLPTVDQEHHFQDKYLFYRFLDDEHEDAPLPTEEEKKECDEELQDTMLLLSQMGPDAHMRMILRKS